MAAWIATFLILVAAVCGAQSQNDDFDFTNGPVPNPFQQNQRYPDRNETVECRPIRLYITRSSRRFTTDLVANDHPRLHFANADARIMSLRLQRHLNELAEEFYTLYQIRITVVKAWAEYQDDDIADSDSLHYEGRTVRLTVAGHTSQLFSSLLQLAVEVGFDWVYYADESYVRMSVIPNLCDISLDMVFMLDRSGSVGEDNFNKALYFLQNVVSFFTIASNETQVGLVTYSTGATIEFDLNDFQSTESVIAALSETVYTRGWTATALALGLTRFILDPGQSYGARPFSDGIPKVAVLLTDGRSNQLPITARADALRNFGVQVYTVGIGDIYLPELRFIASDPDEQHVFLLDSFNDAEGFVDLLSFATCDTPAVVEPGEDTRTEIEEDEFRFFQSRCAAFSQTIMIEQIDLVGRCSLYASSVVPNPGPLDPPDRVVRNEDQTTTYRSVHLTLPRTQDRFVYVSVLGKHRRNEFSIVIWDMIFEQDEYTITIRDSDDVIGQEIINLVEQIGMTDARFNFAIASGNEERRFALGPETGILTVAASLMEGSFQLNIVAQNRDHACHRSKVVVTVVVIEEILTFNPLPQPVTVSEATAPGVQVANITANSSAMSLLTYAIINGNTRGDFIIDSMSGIISVANPLDFETVPEYNLTVQASSSFSSAAINATQIISILDVNEPPVFVTECASSNSCIFFIPENEPANITVGTVTASDPDSPSSPNGMLTYSLQLDSVPFQISNDGVIRTTRPLDFEIDPFYLFIVAVQDGGNPPSPIIVTSVNISVINVLENEVPVFVINCSLEVLESFPANLPLLNCPASDTDEDGNVVNGLVYEIVDGNIDNTFRIDLASGPSVIATNIPLDREQIDLYTLNLTATDPGGLVGSTIIQIIILDINDSPPTCSPPADPLIVSSNALPQPPARTLTIFTAVDPDLNPLPPVFSIEPVVFNPNSTTTVVTVQTTDGEDSTLSSTCTVTIQYGETCFQEYDINSTTGSLSVRLLCSATLDPATVEAPLGASRRFFCNAIANVPLQYEFLQNGTLTASTGTFNELIRLGVILSDAGEYQCRAISDQFGAVLSSTATLTVLLPPVIIMPPSDVVAGVAEVVSFECIASGTPSPIITWIRPNGEELMGTVDGRFTAQGDFLNISNTQTDDSGVYTCEASNSEGVAMATATLTIVEVQQLVMAEVPEYFLPSLDMTCHEFNTSDFNSVLMSITSHETATTDQVSRNLCPPSPCNPSPCKNRGVCMSDFSSDGGYTCQCPPEYVGTNCEEVTDPCQKTPCLNDGLCASNARGKFICSCSDGFHGDRCQYTNVCSSSTPCPPDEMCLETVVTSEGYVCVDVEGGDGEGVSVTVEDKGVGSLPMADLDGEVNIYLEMTADMPGGMKKRSTDGQEDSLEENGFVTVCEGRFIPSFTATNTFILVWACPVGVSAPGVADETAICDLLIQQRLVTSCTSPEGGTIVLPPPTSLPPTAVNITFVLLHPSTNLPLSAGDVLVILEESGALAKLNTTIYRTERFSAVAPPESNSSPSNTGRILGAVIGTLAAIIIVMVVVVTVVCVTRRRRKSLQSSEIRFPGRQNGNGTRNSVTFSNHYAPVPLNTRSSEEKLLTTSLSQQTVFDDPVYEASLIPSNDTYRPPATKKKSLSLERGMRSSLERGMKLMKDKVSSMPRSDSMSGDVLLAPTTGDEDSDDYDDIQPSTIPSMNGSTDPGNEIYANIEHQREGAMGNAGQRWLSYWQTRTLLRTNESESDPTKK